MMMRHTKWFSATLAIALMASTAAAADLVSSGTVKSIDAEKKTFVLTNSGTDNTFKLSENVVVNRAGKEGKSDLKAGDTVYVGYDKGILTWTANYILVQEGKSKHCELIRGTIKSYDTETKQLAFTSDVKKDSTYAVGTAMVRVNMEDAKIDSVKIGDHALLIVDCTDKGTPTLRSVMVERAK